MKQFTQVGPSCWQTSVACILEVSPNALPCQVTLDAADMSYHNAVNSYLIKHHGLFYSQLYPYQFSGMLVRPDWFGGHYVVIGETVRTPISDILHAAVACNGAVVWDPHPSRDGLTSVREWGILGQATESQTRGREVYATMPNADRSMLCLCPECQ